MIDIIFLITYNHIIKTIMYWRCTMDKANAELPQRQRADRRVSKDWAPFAQNLSRVLARLEEDQFLILSA